MIALRLRPLPFGPEHRIPQLGRDHDFVAVREVPQRAAEDLLTRALRVDVRRVEEVDSLLNGVLDERAAFFLTERPERVAAAGLAEGHRADRYRRDIKARSAELDVVHDGFLLLGMWDCGGFRTMKSKLRTVP
jgi:hypothetical protein